MVIWLIIAVLALIGEVLTTGLFLACVGVAAALTAVLTIFVPVTVIDVLAFAGLSLLGIVIIRPILVHTFGMDSLQHTGTITPVGMAGRRAMVTQPVDVHGGQIRIGQGEFWSARLLSGEATLPVGEAVEIVYVEGVTAVVEPVAPATSAPRGEIPVSTSKGDQ